MKSQKDRNWSRRDVLNALTIAGATGLLGMGSDALAAEPPPETKRIRLVRVPSVCHAPQFLAEDLLRSEGFTNVEYVKRASSADVSPTLAAGDADINMNFSGPILFNLEDGHPIVVLAGVHVGCFELFGGPGVRAIRDLKGKTVAVEAMGSSQHVFLSSMLAHVGIDPRRDVRWVTHPSAKHVELLATGKVDAVLAFAPWPQEFRAKKVGHAVVNSMMDRPWSQYFCCLVAGNREFVRMNPVATKRALRAILKATDITAREPEQVARFLVDQGATKNYDYALQTMKDMQMAYGGWRDYDPEDSLRFYALRLHEAGMIKSSPQKLIAQGSDWRFLREIKKELKA